MHCIKIRKYCTRAILVLSLSLQIKATNILLIDPIKDGDCGFEAIALQRHILGFQDTAQSLRKIIAKTYQDRYNLIHDEDIKVFLSDRLASENELRVRANKERLPDIVSLIQEIQKPATDVFTPIFMHDEDVTTLANALNLSIVVYIKDKKIPLQFHIECSTCQIDDSGCHLSNLRFVNHLLFYHALFKIKGSWMIYRD